MPPPIDIRILNSPDIQIDDAFKVADVRIIGALGSTQERGRVARELGEMKELAKFAGQRSAQESGENLEFENHFGYLINCANTAAELAEGKKTLDQIDWMDQYLASQGVLATQDVAHELRDLMGQVRVAGDPKLVKTGSVGIYLTVKAWEQGRWKSDPINHDVSVLRFWLVDFQKYGSLEQVKKDVESGSVYSGANPIGEQIVILAQPRDPLEDIAQIDTE